MNKCMNRAAYTRIADSGMFFLCFIIIAAGIVLGVYLFYQNQANIALVEASILSEKISNAFVVDARFNRAALEDTFDVLAAADMHRAVIYNDNYYVRVEIFQDTILVKKIEEGNRDFSVLCDLEGDKLPQCFTNRFVVDDYVISVVTGVRDRSKA